MSALSVFIRVMIAGFRFDNLEKKKIVVSGPNLPRHSTRLSATLFAAPDSAGCGHGQPNEVSEKKTTQGEKGAWPCWILTHPLVNDIGSFDSFQVTTPTGGSRPTSPEPHDRRRWFSTRATERGHVGRCCVNAGGSRGCRGCRAGGRRGGRRDSRVRRRAASTAWPPSRAPPTGSAATRSRAAPSASACRRSPSSSACSRWRGSAAPDCVRPHKGRPVSLSPMISPPFYPRCP